MNEKIQTGISWILFSVLFLLAGLPPINFIQNSLDPSWMAYLAYSVEHGLQFGKQTIFTYGPLNQIVTHAYSAHINVYIFLYGFLKLVYFILAIQLLGNVRGLIYLALSQLFFWNNIEDPQIYLMLFMISYWLIEKNNSRFISLLCVLSLVLLFYTKFTFSVAIIIPLMILLFRQKYFSLFLFLLLSASLWRITQDSFHSLIPYFQTSYWIAKNYNLSMQNLTRVEYNINNLQAIFDILIYALLPFIIYFFEKNYYKIALIILLGFFAYKESIVRADGHLICLSVFNYGLLLFFILKNHSGFSEAIKQKKIWVSFLCTILVLLKFHYFHFNPSLLKNYKNAENTQKNSMVAINHYYQFPQIAGCGDLYPDNLAPLFASGNQLCVRPIFQSYSAYSKQLLLINAAHLLGNHSPDFIFWKISPIDNRYPTEDDSLSWPIIFAHYKPTSSLKHKYLLLIKTTTNNPYKIEPISTISNITLGKKIEVPRINNLVWIAMQVKMNWLEKVISLVYKANQLNLIVDYDDGSSKSYKLIPGIAKAGFILSPTLNSNADFSCIYKSKSPTQCGKKVIAFTIDTPKHKLSSLYKIKTLTFSKVVI